MSNSERGMNESKLMTLHGLDSSLIAKVMGEATQVKLDDADIYAECVESESFSLEEGVVKTATQRRSHGVGIRAVKDETTGYAYVSTFEGEQLLEAAATARQIASAEGGGDVVVRMDSLEHDLYPVEQSPLDGDVSERVDLMDSIDRRAREADSRVQQVFANIYTEDREILVNRLDGHLVVDRRPLCRLDIRVIVEDSGRRETGGCGGGGRHDFSFFSELSGPGDDPDLPCWARYVDEAVRQALVALDAQEAPAGVMPVVLAPGWPGILLHEAIGHGLEGDFNRKKLSAFSDKMGKSVATPLCTVVDDGTLPGRRGSLNVDDEGTPTSRTVLIEEGVLTGYLTDRLNARLMGMKATGNGRRQSFAHQPMPRMTNTFMLPGPHNQEEIISSVERGIFAAVFGGGQVDITSGQFVFSASEAYLIENGKITAPLRGATLIGNGPEVLTKVSMVADDLALDYGVGTCGKDGQSVPVGVGLPSIRVDALTVGGTQAG